MRELLYATSLLLPNFRLHREAEKKEPILFCVHLSYNIGGVYRHIKAIHVVTGSAHLLARYTNHINPENNIGVRNVPLPTQYSRLLQV